MEKIKRIAVFIGTWFAATCVVLILGVILAPTSPEGNIILGGGFTASVFIIPVIVAILAVNKDKIKAKLPEKKSTVPKLTNTAGQKRGLPRPLLRQNNKSLRTSWSLTCALIFPCAKMLLRSIYLYIGTIKR